MSKYPGVKRRGKKLYIYFPKDGKKRWEVTDCATMADAAKLRAERMSGQPSTRRGPTRFSALLDHYERVWLPRVRYKRSAEKLLAMGRREWATWRVADMTPEALQVWVDHLAARTSPATVLHYTRFIGRVFKVARRTPEGRALVGTVPNPVEMILLPEAPPPRRSAYSVDELRAVLLAIDARRQHQDPRLRASAERLWRWVLLCVAIGLRVHEAARATVADVDLGCRLIKTSGKTGERTAAIPRVLAGEIARWCKGRGATDALIGPATKAPPYEVLRLVYREAGVRWGPGHTLRNLRTTFVQAAQAGGASDEVIAEQAGHSPEVLRENYGRQPMAAKRKAADGAARNLATALLPIRVSRQQRAETDAPANPRRSRKPL